MRIGVVSLKVNENYGGLLQAWALQEVLRRMGHQAVLLDSRGPRPLSLLDKIRLYPIRAIKKVAGISNEPIRHEKMLYENHQKRISCIQHFVRKNIQIRTLNDLGELSPNDFDIYIFGSDQVWRPEYFRSHFGKMTNAFGGFADNWQNVKLASYAASFGIDSLKEFTPEELEQIPNLLHRFRGVGVREASGITLSRQLGVEAAHVIDPTMLLERSDYLRLIETSEVPHRSGIMTYVLDSTPDTDSILANIAMQTGLPLFSTLSPQADRPYPPEQWIAGFRDADMIVTDSFHACVFSILFAKPFIVLGNKARGSARIDSLLNTFGLTDHLVSSVSHLPSNPLKAFDLDHDKVAHRLHQLRSASKEFLTSILS